MKMKVKKIVITLICLVMLALTLSACGSGSESDSIDTQFVKMSDGREAVVITNKSEDQTLSLVQVKFHAYDDEDNEIENKMFHPRAAVVSIFPGESAVGVNDFDPEDWEEKPDHMDYSIEKARFGKGVMHVAVTDAVANYGTNYNITIKNEGSEEASLQEGNFQFFAIFRDDDNKVTGVSDVYVEDFNGEKYPVMAAGEEINTTAEIDKVYPGTCQIVLTWIGVMTQ